VAGSLLTVLGRRNVVRLSRFLLNEARLDRANDPRINGERQLQRFVVGRAPSKQRVVVFDVGANIGHWTQSLLATARTTGRTDLIVHAFEPAPAAVRMFKEALAVEPWASRVHLVRTAVSETCGEGTLYLENPTAERNSLYPAAAGYASREYERTTITTLDEYAKRQRLSHITFAKIDTEGSDMLVMRGAQRLLRAGAIDLLQFEYNHRWIDARQFLRDAFDFLLPFGYRLGKLAREGVEFYPSWDPELETYREGNYVAACAEWTGALPEIRWWNEK
jgi:FkbM family methyltransferase